MQTKAKSNSIVTSEYEEGVITFRIRGAASPILFHLDRVSEANRRRAEVHGWVQRIVDSAAVGMTDADGAIIPAPERDAMKYAAMVKVRDHYESGTEDWARRAVAGERETGGMTLRAVAAVSGVTVDVMRERVKAMAEKRGVTERVYLNSVAGSAAVQAKIAEFRAASPSAIDADALLDELTGGEE